MIVNAIKDLRDWIDRLGKERYLWVLEDEVSAEPDIGAYWKGGVLFFRAPLRY